MTVKRLQIVFFLLLTLAVSGTGSAADGLAMMSVEHGARPSGMGAAFVSVTGDPNATQYNPANAAGITKFTASFGHISYWENIRLESGYFAAPLSGRTFLHGGIRFAAVDELEQRLAPTLEPDELFDAHDISFKSGLTYMISDRIAAGLAMGWYIEKIEAWRGSAFNIDLGLNAKASENVNVGLAMTSIGSDFSLSKSGNEGSRDISLPTKYAAGASWRYQRYLGAFDLVYTDDELHAHLGAEAGVHEMFQVRAGYMANYDSKDFTAGASFTRRNLTVDYAFVPYKNDLGTSHLFSLTFTL
ncbi:MAG: PorV/PorQ family protein [candidate division Zixibacteria bacterium]|nr:PorV/PorQ family protein [candidate division Zixibacteria bacterium]